MAQVFAASENEVQHVKTVVEIESNLITDYKNKLKIGDILIPDPFKIPHGWMEKKWRNDILVNAILPRYIQFFGILSQWIR